MTLKASIMQIINNAVLSIKGTTVKEALGGGVVGPASEAVRKPAARLIDDGREYDPDGEFDDLKKPVMNMVVAFHEAMRCDDPAKLPNDNPFRGLRVSVSEAWVYEGIFDKYGKRADAKVLESRGITWPQTYRIRHIEGDKAASNAGSSA